MFTNEQKDLIKELREDNKSYKVIADMLDTTKNTVKGYCNSNGLGGFRAEGFRVKEDEFKERFEKQQSAFVYHSGYVGSHDRFMCQCRICGHIQGRNALCARLGLDGFYIQCDNCNRLEKESKRIEQEETRRKWKRKENEYSDAICKWCGNVFTRQGNAQLYCGYDCYRESEKNHIEYTKQCKECGCEFTALHNGNAYCSTICRARKKRRHRGLSKDARLRVNGKIDYSITLVKLIKRDKNICHICGGKCNTTDYKIVNGYFIAGESYSSTDHLLPRSKGGTHTWDNIKLAHRGCNNDKLNHLFYGGLGKQITMSI